MADTTPLLSPTRIVDPHIRNISEAQSRGFYRSPQSPAPRINHLGPYALSVPWDIEATDRSPKRFRRTEEEKEEKEDMAIDASENALPHENVQVVIPSARVSGNLRGSTGPPGQPFTPPSTLPSVSPRDPRLRGRDPPALDGREETEPQSPPGQNDDPDPLPRLTPNADHLPHHTRDQAQDSLSSQQSPPLERSSPPNDNNNNDMNDATITAMNAYAEEQRLRRQELEQSSQRHRERMRGLESGWEAKIRLGREKAERARKAAEEEQDREYERREAELSRQWMRIEMEE